MVDTGLLLLAVIGFVAFVVRGITGAASAIVFNALFGLLLALGLLGDLTLLEGLYWLALADLFGSIVLVIVLRGEIEFEPFTRRLILFSLPVAAVLAIALPSLDLQLLAVGLGVALVGSGLYLAARPQLGIWDEPTMQRRAAPMGLLAGVLSGLYGMAAPVIVVYLAHAGPDTGRFRARATAIAIVFSSTRVLALVAAGAIGIEGLGRFAVTAPLVLLGLGVGLWLHPRVGPRAFRTGLGLIVVLAGAFLAVRSLFA